MDTLVNSSRRSPQWCYSYGSALGEQRRYAEVASDLARSPVFTSVLLESGRLATFLRQAVVVLTRAGTERVSRNAEILFQQNCAATGGRRTLAGDRDGMTSNSRRGLCLPPPPEPLLLALSSFCLEHSPARSAFVQALLDTPLGEQQQPTSSANHVLGADDRDATCSVDPISAMFALCLDAHSSTAMASSALLQCLLVGGGALGAVSGPSPGAAGGVGVIPATYPTVGARDAGVAVGGGIGREDPLQAKLLERIASIALVGRRKGYSSALGSGTGKRGDASSKERAVVKEGSGATSAASRRHPRGDEKENGPGSCSSTSGSENELGDDKSDDAEDWACGGLVARIEGLTIGDGLPSSSLKDPLLTGSQRSFFPPGAALAFIFHRLQQLGAHLAYALAKEQVGFGAVSCGGGVGMAAATAATEMRKRVTFAGAGGGGGKNCGTSLRERSVEAEQEVTSLLCLLSSLVSFSGDQLSVFVFFLLFYVHAWSFLLDVDTDRNMDGETKPGITTVTVLY